MGVILCVGEVRRWSTDFPFEMRLPYVVVLLFFWKQAVRTYIVGQRPGSQTKHILHNNKMLGVTQLIFSFIFFTK